jgi:hypothetical protein
LNLKQVGGDIDFLQYGGTFATKKLSNGDFDYWLFVELINMEEATGDTDFDRYTITIRAVSPTEPSEKTKKSALYTLGLESYENKMHELKPLDMAVILNDDGVGAMIFSDCGNNANELFKIARDECDKIAMLFGFYMDRQLNAIGNTGWDFIKGEIGFNN